MAGRVLDDEPVGAETTTFDLFWDLTGTDWDAAAARDSAVSAGFPEQAQLGVAAAGDSGPVRLGSALRDAAAAGRGLAVVVGSWLPPFPALLALAGLTRLDPLIASVQPRFAVPQSGKVWALPVGRESAGMLHPADLPWLTDVLITPELPAPATLLAPAAVGALAARAATNADVGAAALLTIARRLGFRNAVANGIVVDYPSGDPYASLVDPDADGASEATADRDRARSWLAALPDARLERILVNAYRNEQPRLLLDARHMPPTHNGTSHAILGILDGFAATDQIWHLELVASTAAIEFHGLRSRYPALEVTSDIPQARYIAAVHLTQPWLMGTFADLHDRAIATFFYVFDTIAWDIIYAAPDNLDAVWRFAGAWADGLIFDSAFTRARFERRFGTRPGIATTVAHLSLAADDYQLADAGDQNPAGPDIVVMGNSYDHKDVDRTAHVLAAALPGCEIVAFGGTEASADAAGSPVTIVPSGKIDDRTVETLQASARVIVYPSYYEGFGLPVPFGLANGRTVVVRHSELWSEIADYTRMPGSLVTFVDDEDLIDVVRRSLAGSPVDALPQGGMLAPGDDAPNWRACADTILDTVQTTVARRDGDVWRQRDIALSVREVHGELERDLRERTLERDDLARRLLAVATELQATRDRLAAAADGLRAAADELAVTSAQRDAAERELTVMRGTISWRITTPLRRARQWMRQRGTSRPRRRSC